MTIEGVGAGKGDVYRPVNRDTFNDHFKKIKGFKGVGGFKRVQTRIGGYKLRKVYK